MLHCNPEAGRRAVIEDVDGIAIEADDLGETVDRSRDLIEAMAAARHVGVAEARQVGGNDVEAIGQERDEVAEHVAGAREAVQQQQLRGARRTGLAIEDLEAVHVGGSVLDGGHGGNSFELGVTCWVTLGWLGMDSLNRSRSIYGVMPRSRPGPLRSPRGGRPTRRWGRSRS